MPSFPPVLCRLLPRTAAFLAIAFLLAPAEITAAGSATRPREVNVTWPAKQPHPKAGKLAVYSGEVDEVGVMFKIPAGTVFSRCGVVLKAEGQSPSVTVRLKNEFSPDWDRSATTDASGKAVINYRTEGGAWVWIKSNGGRCRYQLGIFQGNELPVHRKLATPFLTKAEFEAGQKKPAGPTPSPAPAPAGGTSPVLWVIAGLLGLVVIGLGILILRKKS